MKHRQAGGRATSARLSGAGGVWQSLELMVDGERLIPGVWVEGMYLVRIV